MTLKHHSACNCSRCCVPLDGDVVERLTAFVQRPKWGPDDPENNLDWQRGYEAAQDNLREELKSWWPRGGPLDFTATRSGDGELREALEKRTATLIQCDHGQWSVVLRFKTGDDANSAIAALSSIRDR